MTAMLKLPKEVNQVHEAENWRSLVMKETKIARQFQDNWGYLVQAQPGAESSAEVMVVPTKYFDAKSKGYTVRAKRARLPAALQTLQRQLASGASARSAASQTGGPLHSTASAHLAALATIRGGDARGLMYQTSNSQYGARASLEQFPTRAAKLV